MISLSELFPEEKRRLHELENQIIELEKGNSKIQVSDIRLSISEMNRRLEELEKLVNKESKTYRSDMKRRYQHLKSTYDNIVLSLENYDKRRYQQDYSLQKYELFGKYSNIDPELANIEITENKSLEKSNIMLSEYLVNGKETLMELISQRERLKSVQKKVFDILNLLGISNTIMRNVEKRDLHDKYIVFGGMFIVLLILAFVFFYLRG